MNHDVQACWKVKIMMRSLFAIICLATYIVPSFSMAETANNQMLIEKAFIEANFEPYTNVHYGSVRLMPEENATDVLDRIECENGVVGNVWLKYDTRRYIGGNETLFIPPSGLWVGPAAGLEANGYASMIDDAHIVFRKLPEHLAVDGHVKCRLSFERAGMIDVDFIIINNMKQLINF